MPRKRVLKNVPAKTSQEHPDHSDDLKRLNRVKGQLEGIEGMIEDRRYCPDIINQVQASISALKSLQKQLLERHLHHCVASAFEAQDHRQRETKIKELLKLISR